MKNFVKVMNKEEDGFMYLWHRFLLLSNVKLTEGIFIGPQTRDQFIDGNFKVSMSNKENAVWEVCDDFWEKEKMKIIFKQLTIF